MDEKNRIKIKFDKMQTAIKNAYIYQFDPIPPSRKAMELRKLIEYAKITEFKK